MDKLIKAVAGVCSPLFNEWRVKAALTSDEAAIFWLKEFEDNTFQQVALKVNYSERQTIRIYNKAKLKILKIL